MPEARKESFFIELLKFIVIAALIVFPVRFFIAQPFIVSGASMDPTFENGQYLIIDEISYRFSEPKRGEVIIFRPPRAPQEFYIKRIIGLPGETVSIEDGRIYVTTNGQKHVLDEPYISRNGNGADATYELEANEYFVMGDNRPESSDSRVWGPLPSDNIVGRAFVRLLPANTLSLFPGSVTYPQ
ncbi:signal peptidase I [Candidatus Nomurabacteria bacterium]|nr:signal peptidase I [Candidatus Nomurabacteria bacterium]